MAEIRIEIDDAVLQAASARAARMGIDVNQVVEQALRRDLGFELLDRLWAANGLDPDEAVALAVEAQHATRPRPDR